jgi:hypothetical protein
MQFSPPSCYFPSFKSKYFSQQFIVKYHQPTVFSQRSERPSFTPIKQYSE